jgi:acyl carrier protein
MTILERVQDVVARVLRVPRERVMPTARLSELADLDSLSLAEIASALDDEFHTRIPADDLMTVHSVADLVGVVDRSQTG